MNPLGPMCEINIKWGQQVSKLWIKKSWIILGLWYDLRSQVPSCAITRFRFWEEQKYPESQVVSPILRFNYLSVMNPRSVPLPLSSFRTHSRSPSVLGPQKLLDFFLVSLTVLESVVDHGRYALPVSVGPTASTIITHVCECTTCDNPRTHDAQVIELLKHVVGTLHSWQERGKISTPLIPCFSYLLTVVDVRFTSFTTLVLSLGTIRRNSIV